MLSCLLTPEIAVLSFVGATGSTTISFILPGLFYWKVISSILFERVKCSVVLMKRRMPQLTRDDGSSRALNSGAFAMMVYGLCVFVFWCVLVMSSRYCSNILAAA